MSNENRSDRDERPLSYTPGALEEKETPAARANREQQRDTTSMRPAGTADGTTPPNPPADREHRSDAADEGDRTRKRPPPGTAADPLR